MTIQEVDAEERVGRVVRAGVDVQKLGPNPVDRVQNKLRSSGPGNSCGQAGTLRRSRLGASILLDPRARHEGGFFIRSDDSSR